MRKNLKISYIVEGNSSPMIIRNDMGVRLYTEVKKKNKSEFVIYPLCIDTSDKINEEIQCF